MQELETKPKNNKRAQLLTVSLSLLLLLTFGAAIYSYLQQTSATQKVDELQTELSTAKTKISALQNATAEDKDYETLPLLGVRYKQTDVTRPLISAYEAGTADISTDTIYFTTVELSRIERKGTSGTSTFPCGFKDNISLPSITRYKTDRELAMGKVSTLGKKVGDEYFVYHPPQSLCITTHTDAQNALSMAVKQIYDSLEAVK